MTATATRTGTSTPTRTPSLAASLSGRVRYYHGDRGVGGVSLAGATSSADGTFTAATGLGAAVTLLPQRLGGFNGGASALDAAYVLQVVAGLRSFDASQARACDATGNGTLSALDAARILELTVGMRSRLPVAQACGSDWLFMPEPAAVAGQTITQPSLNGSCTPGAIAFAALPASATGQDFRAALFGDCTGNWQAGAALRRWARRPARRRRARPGRRRRAAPARARAQRRGGIRQVGTAVPRDDVGPGRVVRRQ